MFLILVLRLNCQLHIFTGLILVLISFGVEDLWSQKVEIGKPLLSNFFWNVDGAFWPVMPQISHSEQERSNLTLI